MDEPSFSIVLLGLRVVGLYLASSQATFAQATGLLAGLIREVSAEFKGDLILLPARLRSQCACCVIRSMSPRLNDQAIIALVQIWLPRYCFSTSTCRQGVSAAETFPLAHPLSSRFP